MMTIGKHDLSIRGLTKRYDPSADEAAVDDVNLEVRKGEFVSLLGPSGSGKTTTLMVIAGFEDATSGDILVDGRSIVRIPPDKRDIGVVFQNYALFPKMTVAQNIAFPLRMRHRPKDEIQRTVRRFLQLIDLPGYEDRYPRQLSGGQQQRVALARALSFDPKILLLDEPMGALDRGLREQLQMELKQIQRKLEITAIFVTHDQEEAMVLSDRIVIMSNGRAQQVGTPAEVYYRPANRFVAQFLGTANLLPAEVVSAADGGGMARLGGAEVPFTFDASLAQGGEVDLFVRPECIDILPEDQSPLKGSIETVVFVGNQTRFSVRIPGATVNVTTANRTGLTRHSPGDRVSLSWAGENARAL